MNYFYCIIVLCSICNLVIANEELDKLRIIDSYDRCLPENQTSLTEDATTFQERINFWVQYFEENNVSLSMEEINPLFHVKNPIDGLSLSSIEHCELNPDQLSIALKHVPDAETISSLNYFYQNNLSYKKIFSCLAMIESLGDPDTTTSKSIYKNLTGKKNKPPGVKFYIDPYQKKESELNVGLFQFTPNINGNINPCIKSWNKMFQDESQCQIKNNQDALLALSSSGQNFNSFCGVHKIIETASIQLRSQNTSAHFSSHSHCSSLQMRAGVAYNHFGPLQNSTGKNLKLLSQCLVTLETN